MAKKMYVAAMLLYSTTVVLLFSALVSDRWIVHANEKIAGITRETSALVWLAFVTAFVGFVLLWFRTMRSHVGSWAKLVGIAGIGTTAVLGVAGVLLFQHQVRTNPGESYGFGYNTTLAAAINAFIPFALLVVHEAFYRETVNRDRMSSLQLKLVASFTLFFVYLEFGGICYSYIEDWPMVNALLFAMVTCASIGYGNTTANQCAKNYRNEGAFPITTGGRIFTLFYLPIGYALIGWFFKCLWDVIILTINRRVHRTKKGDSDGPISDRWMFVYGLCGTIGILLVGALIFKFSEDWSYWDAFWFCFVTLTTVGYGDLVPNPQHYYFFFIWLVIGLGCVAYFLNAVSKLLVDPMDKKVAIVNTTRKEGIDHALADYIVQMEYVLSELPADKAQMHQIAWASVRQAIADADDRFAREQNRVLVGITPSVNGSVASSRDSFASVRSSVDGRRSHADGDHRQYAFGDPNVGHFAHYQRVNFKPGGGGGAGGGIDANPLLNAPPPGLPGLRLHDLAKTGGPGYGGGGGGGFAAAPASASSAVSARTAAGAATAMATTELFPPGTVSPYFPYQPPTASTAPAPRRDEVKREDPSNASRGAAHGGDPDEHYHLLKD